VQSIEDFFAGGAKAAKFEDRAYGTVIGGEIVADPVMRQQRDYETDEPMTYPDGNPMMQMLVTVQAVPPTDDDDGQRTFYIRGQLKSAVGEALRKVGVKAPQRGGRLWVKYVSDEPVTLKNGKRGNDKKIHAAKYEPPAQATAGQFFDEQAGNMHLPPDDPAADRTSSPAWRPAEQQPATRGGERPDSIPSAVWEAMSTDQQQQIAAAARGLAGPARAQASRFTEEPPF